VFAPAHEITIDAETTTAGAGAVAPATNRAAGSIRTTDDSGDDDNACFRREAVGETALGFPGAETSDGSSAACSFHEDDADGPGMTSMLVFPASIFPDRLLADASSERISDIRTGTASPVRSVLDLPSGIIPDIVLLPWLTEVAGVLATIVEVSMSDDDDIEEAAEELGEEGPAVGLDLDRGVGALGALDLTD
jgi:hypothetical protein